MTASLENVAETIELAPAGKEKPAAKYLVNRSRDGLFYVDGQINDVPIKFAVDTGASVVVLNAADATRVGLTPKQTATHRIRTAGGYSDMRWSHADKLSVAGKKLGQIEIAVMEGGPKTSLLGLSALSRFETLTIKKDQLIIE
ncbi:hypothetical protein GCM10009096_25580 [Parasphingorhabdus litoris]|uniref:TIGR02281 family clan AA aspartic protease n=1 Tax=Parasphingorhabdus litoris TaxID=394733 RepID=A0ABN1ARZ9_9SPHN|nr:retropepsin-like aspartic protease [Parasphingorhabdus litoris]